MERSMTPILYGHRGAKGEAPENTLTGFAYAQQLGVTAFELDVHLAADGELVVIHDARVDRTTNSRGPVSGFTSRELAALDARAAFPAWPEPAGVPRLVDVLDAFAGTQSFQIEIKTASPVVLEAVAQKLVALIGQYNIAGRTEISSFDPAALAIVRRIAPEISCAYIGAYDTPEFLATALSLGCAGACIPHKTSTRATVDEAHAAGLHVTGWLGDTPLELRLLLDWGVESITSDFPSVALKVLQAQTSAP
jgi:glycerophosphoryl diester phosphodiesterase